MAEPPDDGGLRFELSEPPRARGPRHRGTLVALLVVLALLAGVAVAVVVGLRSLGLVGAPDYSGPGTGSVVVQVHPGDSARAIGATLHSAGVVKSTNAFVDAARNDPRSLSIGPGFYRLRRHMAAKDALALLLDPSSLVRSRVTVPEGFTVDQVLQRLARDTELSLADLQRVARQPAALRLPTACHAQLEGCLFPATYDVAPDATAAAALQAMVDRFREAAADVDLEAGAKALGRSDFQVLVVASLVEREAKFDADRPKVAEVVYNRLRRGMPLQLDSTVNYALHENKAYVTNQDTKVASPYNTYLHAGLPPTPIASPGQAALEAALHPAQGDLLYFVTIDKAGHNAFTSDYQEFLRLKAQGEQARR